MSFDLTNAGDYPFLRFAEDAGEYHRSWLFWADAFAGVMDAEADRWAPWTADPFHDGHPMFSVIDRSGRRAVLLQQVLNENDPVWFKCWMSTSGDADGRQVEFLFVETFVSAPGRRLFQDLIVAWCRERRSFKALERLTDGVRRDAADRSADTEFGWPAPETPRVGR